MQNFGEIPIDALNLSNRTIRLLYRNRIRYLIELIQVVESGKIMEFRMMGEKSLSEIRKAIDEIVSASEDHLIVKKEKSNKEGQYNTISITELGLPGSITGALMKNQIKSIGDLIRINPNKLYTFNRIGPKAQNDIYKALDEYLNLDKTLEISKVKVKSAENSTWAELVEPFFLKEKDIRLFVLICRFGTNIYTLEEISSKINLTRERVRQIQQLAARNFYNHTRRRFNNELQLEIFDILNHYGKDLSLKMLKSILTKKHLLGKFTTPIIIRGRIKLEPVETLIIWLSIISDSKYVPYPRSLPIDITSLREAKLISIKDVETLKNISTKRNKKVIRKVLFTGAIKLKEAARIFSVSEKIAIMQLRELNLIEVKNQWFSFKSIDVENKRMPLRLAGLKMLAVNNEIDYSTFYDGLLRHSNRFYDRIAPPDIVLHILELLGFEITEHKVTTSLPIENVLSKSERCFVEVVNKNDGVVSFLEIAEAFFSNHLSLPAVSVVLTRSPVSDKVETGLYKIRGREISWKQIESAKERQEKISQNEEVSFGLDGIVRFYVTVTNYAYLTGVVSSYRVKDLAGNWKIMFGGNSFGDAKMDENFLWGLSDMFKELNIKIGDRIEMAFNTWDRTLIISRG